MSMRDKKDVAFALGLVLAGATIASGASAQDMEAPRNDVFSGPYVGVDVGSQNLFGGSLVGGVDMLAQESRAVVEFLGGWRWQFDNGLVFGVEGQFGFTDGNLTLSDPANLLLITYENDAQYGYGATFGRAFGSQRDLLLFGYVFDTTREFDVTIQNAFGTFTQNDEQGFIRYGLGVEKQIHNGWIARASLGQVSADFTRQTNIDVEDKTDFTFAILYQF